MFDLFQPFQVTHGRGLAFAWPGAGEELARTNVFNGGSGEGMGGGWELVWIFLKCFLDFVFLDLF